MALALYDYICLVLTALVAIYLIYRFFQYKPQGYLWYSLSFLILLVAGLLLVFGGSFDVLAKKWVKVVATIIPFSLAIGLMCQYYKKLATLWIIILLIGLVLIALNTYGTIGGKIWYPIFHAFAGLTIFFVPIFIVGKKQAPGALLWVTLGGALIGLGGIALAFLTLGKQFLFFSADLVFAILTPLLLVMTLAYTLGFVKVMKLEAKNE